MNVNKQLDQIIQKSQKSSSVIYIDNNKIMTNSEQNQNTLKCCV